MRSIISPYYNDNFNKYLLSYIKKSLKKKCDLFSKDENEIKYYIDEDSPSKFYTQGDIIKSLVLKNNVIYFSNMKLINYAVYDLGQRFWYNEINAINNMVSKIYFDYIAIAELNKKSSLVNYSKHKGNAK